MVLILVLIAVFTAPLSATDSGQKIKTYLKETRFPSGFQASDSCEWRLTSGTAAFRKKNLREQILELHARAHEVAVTAYELKQIFPLGPEALQEFAVRTRIVGEVSKKRLLPYSSELLAMAFEASAITHMAHRHETLPMQNLAVFFERVLEIAEPRNNIERVFAVTAAASLGNITSSFIERSNDPAARLKSTLEVLVKGVAWSDQKPETVFPLLNASLAAVHKAILFFHRVPKEHRGTFIGMTELLFSGAEVMLKRMSEAGEPQVERSFRILMNIYETGERKAFSKINQTVDNWGILLGKTEGVSPPTSPKTH